MSKESCPFLFVAFLCKNWQDFLAYNSKLPCWVNLFIKLIDWVLSPCEYLIYNISYKLKIVKDFQDSSSIPKIVHLVHIVYNNSIMYQCSNSRVMKNRYFLTKSLNLLLLLITTNALNSQITDFPQQLRTFFSNYHLT